MCVMVKAPKAGTVVQTDVEELGLGWQGFTFRAHFNWGGVVHLHGPQVAVPLDPHKQVAACLHVCTQHKVLTCAIWRNML